MLSFPLSRYDKKLLKEFSERISKEKTPNLTQEEVLKYKVIIDSMKELDAIYFVHFDNGNIIAQHNFDIFKQIVDNEDKKSRRPAKRDIAIAVFSVTASAVVSFATALLTLFCKGI